jgi:hypothetical protein
LPRAVGTLCIDPHATFRSYGEGAKASLGAACEVLEGDCAGYVRFGLRRVHVVPYVSGGDPRARITVTLLELASPEASFALYSERTLGDAPNDATKWKALDASGTAVLAGAQALAWHGSHLAELDYADETSAPGRALSRGAPLLEMLARELALRLPGKAELPPSVALLPKRDGGPRKIQFEHESLFGIEGLGAGAVARYAPSGAERPLAVLARADEDSAKDVLRTLRRVPGSRPFKGAPYEALSVPIQPGEGSARVEWLFGRKRNVVLGIGYTPAKLDRKQRERERHAELSRLKTLLDEFR